MHRPAGEAPRDGGRFRRTDSGVEALASSGGRCCLMVGALSAMKRRLHVVQRLEEGAEFLAQICKLRRLGFGLMPAKLHCRSFDLR